MYQGNGEDDMAKIYLADDTKEIRDIISAFLSSDGYICETFENGDLLFDRFLKDPCDLVLLDVMMPGSDGFSILAKLRRISHVPVIMITAKDSDNDCYSGLLMGSDDYITKPFKPLLLSAKIRALLRRAEFERGAAAGDAVGKLTCGNFYFSAKKHEVTVDGKRLAVTPTEMKFLAYVAGRFDEAVSRDEILDAVWGLDSDIDTRVADETNRRIRRKLVDAGADVYIETVWGYGFRMIRKEGRV